MRDALTPTDDGATRAALTARESGSSPTLDGLAAGALPLLALAVHLCVNATTDLGVHRDELLYLAMGRHLRLWRMDPRVRRTSPTCLAGPS